MWAKPNVTLNQKIQFEKITSNVQSKKPHIPQTPSTSLFQQLSGLYCFVISLVVQYIFIMIFFINICIVTNGGCKCCKLIIHDSRPNCGRLPFLDSQYNKSLRKLKLLLRKSVCLKSISSIQCQHHGQHCCPTNTGTLPVLIKYSLVVW